MLSATIAKWFVPSVSALFLVTGYVVHWAYQDLLGTSVGNADSSTYAANAAGFLHDLPTVVVDALLRLLTSGEVSSLGGHGAELGAGVLLVFTVLQVPRLLAGRVPGWLPSVLAPAALLILVAGKFVFFDAPIGRIDNVVVGVGIASNTNGSHAEGRSIETRLAQRNAGHALDRFILGRANEIWTNMVCSRVSPEAAGLGAGPRRENICMHTQAASQSRIVDEFVAHTAASLLIAILAVRLLRTGSTAVVGLALLASLYLLTWPYAYGKLMKSTYFEYGYVRLALPPPEDDPAFGTTGAAGAAAANQSSTQHAIVLSRQGGGVDMLVVKQGTCGKTPIRYSAIKVWSVPASQLRSIQEIYREDVIAWKTLNEKPCPKLPAPGSMG